PPSRCRGASSNLAGVQITSYFIMFFSTTHGCIEWAKCQAVELPPTKQHIPHIITRVGCTLALFQLTNLISSATDLSLV
ncbi:unnamed protein product, partial [Mycena citricolor]